MPGVARVGSDSAGGTQLGGGQGWVRIGGDLVVVRGDQVASHAPCPDRPHSLRGDHGRGELLGEDRRRPDLQGGRRGDLRAPVDRELLGEVVMTDIAVRWSDGYGDLALEGADLGADKGLATAVIVSLFTDRRVEAHELAEGDTDRRGWWGDGVADDGDEIGSRLWLLERSKSASDALLKAELYSREALEWFIETGSRTASRPRPSGWSRGTFAINVLVARGDETLYLDAFEMSVPGP